MIQFSRILPEVFFLFSSQPNIHLFQIIHKLKCRKYRNTLDCVWPKYLISYKDADKNTVYQEREKKTRAKSMLICSFDEMTRDNFITVYFTKNNCVFFVVFFFAQLCCMHKWFKLNLKHATNDHFSLGAREI